MAKPNGNRFSSSRPPRDDAVGPDPVSLYLREIVLRRPLSLDESVNEESLATYGDSLADWRIVPTDTAAGGHGREDRSRARDVTPA